MFRIISSIAVGIAFLASAAVQAAPPAIAAGAPDSYTVAKGDTMWGISGRFLQEPWRWPEVWQMNEDEIKNPHLIHPGQIIVLDRSGPYLRIGKRIGEGSNSFSGRPAGDGKLQPRIYETPVDDAISTIPLKAIAPFLTRPLVINEESLQAAATIVATETNRVYLAQGDTVFARDVTRNIDKWAIFRSSKPLVDPTTRQVLGYETQYLGSAKVKGRSDPVTLEIVEAVEEIGVGDKMLPAEGELVFSYAPHAPKETINARLISIYRGVSETGKLSVVVVGAGKQDGLEPGHVVAMFRNRGTATHERNTYVLPEKRYGSAMIFRVFDNVSYALIIDTEGQAAIGDSIRNP
ncbi:MAG: LysM peptidoglycan-binding domain-containing protein [Betaproteobacteria bacterium]|nr:LysM peptidoglycan-binding domain-containing protein [Betaproteobacteria bacterium]